MMGASARAVAWGAEPVSGHAFILLLKALLVRVLPEKICNEKRYLPIRSGVPSDVTTRWVKSCALMGCIVLRNACTVTRFITGGDQATGIGGRPARAPPSASAHRSPSVPT